MVSCRAWEAISCSLLRTDAPPDSAAQNILSIGGNDCIITSLIISCLQDGRGKCTAPPLFWSSDQLLSPNILRAAAEKGFNMQQIQWRDRFNIGVDVIDQAHRRLFSIVQKMMDLYVERHEDKFACVEGIKYFKSYAVKHFEEEEAYMRKIGYSGYSAHKKHHDKMKLETLPELERLLYASNFSTEMVQRFIGVCTGWLTGHIMIEDRAIIGQGNDNLAPMRPAVKLSVIQSVILLPLQEIFGCKIQYIGKFSTKDAINYEQCYELVYTTQEGSRLRVILVMGEQMLLRAAGVVFGIDFYEKSAVVSFAIQEIAQNLIQRAASSFGKQPDEYQLEKGHFLDYEEFSELFKDQSPQYSLLFHVGQESFALCIDQKLNFPAPTP